MTMSPRLIGFALLGFGFFLLLLFVGGVVAWLAGWGGWEEENRWAGVLVGLFGLLLTLVGVSVVDGRPMTASMPRIPCVGPIELILGRPVAPDVRELPAEREHELEQRRRDPKIPGATGPPSGLLRGMVYDRSMPTSDPMVPMYWLDAQYRILDWNTAFSLVFDRTMEGRRGHSVLEWLYFLDNYQEAVQHGILTFGDPHNLPRLDVEVLRYQSLRYGAIKATKRAYQIPADNESLRGWLVILDPEFDHPQQEATYYEELLWMLSRDLLWSEYALSYDKILTETEVYWHLLRTVLGELGELDKPTPGSRILDLGAGTGNAAQLLAQENRHLVVALENNTTMLSVLKSKCREFLREDDGGPGILPVKQDATSLYGLRDNDYDYVVAINMLYAVDDAEACLKEIQRVLRPGGEVRISGPKKNSDVGRLLRAIKRDLKQRHIFERLRPHYDRVSQINQYRLASLLYRWSVGDVQDMLRSSGFREIGWSTERAYAGDAMIVTARK